MAARPQEPLECALGWGGTEQQENLSRCGMADAQLDTAAPEQHRADGPAQPRGTSPGPESLRFRVYRWEATYPIGWSVSESMHITQIADRRAASASGLQVGMRVLEIDGKQVRSASALDSAVAGKAEFDVEVGLGRWAVPQSGGGWRPVTSVNLDDMEVFWDPATGLTSYKGPDGGPREGARAQSSPAPSGRTALSPRPSPDPESPDRSQSPPPASPCASSSCKRAGPEGSPTERNRAASPRCTSPLLSPTAPQRKPTSKLAAISRYLACAACCPSDTDSAQSQ
eukprot:TRINITY_DN1555_c0_g2_i1.p1 TRINITY_DN1555_c0_g2~~TRINITY_DN1555_c0_g2_i1.p1  ORF type:complete len:284 (+),score=40.43 TRINITY_DN1555_c0_g2_i1:76-927(+)